MRQTSETSSVLEMRERRGEACVIKDWHRPMAGMYQPAKTLANQGRLIESLEKAYEIRQDNYGDSIGVDFRIITYTTTLTTLNDQSE